MTGEPNAAQVVPAKDEKMATEWPKVGLETRITYFSNFVHLNINLGGPAQCDRYFSEWIARYRRLIKGWGDMDVAIWSIRMRQSLKSAFTATHFALAAQDAKKAGSHASFYYLAYYAVFHALWGVMYLHPDESTDAIIKPTHTKLANVFQSCFCGEGGIIRYSVREIAEDLRFRREYYSYRMPLNSPFEDEDDARGATVYVGGLVKQCIQLSNLHSHLIHEAATRNDFAVARVPPDRRDEFTKMFLQFNSQAHPARPEPFLDPADEQALQEWLLKGCDLWGHSIMFEHMTDQYMNYAGNGLRDKDMAKQVISLVYGALY